MVETTIVNRRDAERFHADANGAFRILALDGGGVRGIYPATVLAQLEEALGKPVADCFDLLAGTSTGAIVAGAAAAGIGMAEVVGLFENHAQTIFKKSWFRWPLFHSRYRAEPLEKIVRGCVSSSKLGEVRTPLMITSSNISTGNVQVFKSAYLRELGHPYVRDGNIPLSDAIMASCAVPSYFDPVKVNDALLADGGLWANNPSIIALIEALSKFGKSIEQVYILSISTGHAARMYGHSGSWGLLTGWKRQMLVSYVMGLQSQASSNMAKLTLGDRFIRLDPEIEDWGLDDTQHMDNLKALAENDFANHANHIIDSIRRSR